MIGLLLGVVHYLEAAFMETRSDDSTVCGEYLGEYPHDIKAESAQLQHEMLCEEWLHEEEERYNHEVTHGWEDAWHDSFFDYFPE